MLTISSLPCIGLPAKHAKPKYGKAKSSAGSSQSEVFSYIEREALWPAESRLVVAVSGGADSLCLLGLLVELQSSGHTLAPSELIVAHLDHGLRGEAGQSDALWVGELADELGLSYCTEYVDVGALARTATPLGGGRRPSCPLRFPAPRRRPRSRLLHLYRPYRG